MSILSITELHHAEVSCPVTELAEKTYSIHKILPSALYKQFKLSRTF
jgi:hypothetical protein